MVVPNRKNFLYICIHSPFETCSGSGQRTALLFEALCQIGHVDLICFTDAHPPGLMKSPNYTVRFFGNIRKTDLSRKLYITNKLKFWSRYSVYPLEAQCADVVKQALRGKTYDHIVLRYLETAFITGLAYHKNLVVDVDDVPWQRLWSYVRDPDLHLRTRFFYGYSCFLSWIHLRRFMKTAGRLFFSNKDQVKGSNATHLPNIPFPRKKRNVNDTEKGKENTILFLGTLSYKPNWMGVDYFIRNIWKRVLTEIPDARFAIAGKGAPPELARQWLNHPNIELLGYVSDVATAYRRCIAVVAPIYHGAGTNIKVLEAMAMGRACVVSSFATRGLNDLLQNRQNVIITRSNKEFSAGIVELIKNSALNDHIRINAAKTIQNALKVDVFHNAVRSAFVKPADR